MAKDDRKILRGIRPSIPKGAAKNEKTVKTFVAGMEDELAAVLTQEQLDAAVERGDIEGTWKHVSKAETKKSEEKK